MQEMIRNGTYLMYIHMIMQSNEHNLSMTLMPQEQSGTSFFFLQLPLAEIMFHRNGTPKMQTKMQGHISYCPSDDPTKYPANYEELFAGECIVGFNGSCSTHKQFKLS